MVAEIDALRHDNPLNRVAADFGVPLEKDGREFVACCPFHQEDTPSFTIFVGQDGVERFQCFGCGAQGDVLDFVRQIKGCDLPEAIRILGGEGGRPNVAPRAIADAVDPYAGIVSLPPIGAIHAAKRVKLWNPKRAKFGTITPSMVFPYRGLDGAILGYVLRHDLPDGGKETPMVMWCEVPGQGATWCRYPFPKPRPIFGLDRLGAARQVIIAEGEKCATIGAAVTGRVFLSWPGGTYGMRHTDWSPLAGRSVVIWPDADAPGLKVADDLAAVLTGMGCAVKVLDVTGKPKGWDVADAADEGWTREEIDGFMRSQARPWVGVLAGGAPEVQPTRNAAPRLAYEAPRDDPGAPHHPHDEADANLVPDPYGGLGDMPMDRSDGLVEYGTTNRRAVPVSGRPKPGGVFRVWGGDQDALRDWVFLSAHESFCNVHTGEIMSRAAFDLVMGNVVPMVETMNAKGESKNIVVPASKCLLNYLGGIVCSATMYRPDVDDLIVSVDGILHLNSYLAASAPVAAKDWESHDAWRIARDHIYNILPDGAETLIQWLAHNVQRPGKKILWAPVIVGVQGDGKTTIGKILQMAMGRRNVSPLSPEALFSDYTAWASGKCVRVLEEIRVPDKGSRTVVMDKIKPMITNDVIDVVGKHKDGADVANVTNYMGMTNHLDALAVDEGDRRWEVWRTRFKDRQQMLDELDRRYWVRLHEAIGKNPEVIRGWLMSIDLSAFDPYSAPAISAAKADMIEASRSPIHADIREAIMLGAVGVGQEVLVTDALNDAVRAIGNRSVNTTTLANILRDMGWTRYPHGLKWNSKTRRVYYRPGGWSDGLEGADLAVALRAALRATESDRPDEDWLREPNSAGFDLSEW